MINVGIGGDNRIARVTEHFALLVAQELPDIPPLNTPNRSRFFRALLGTQGAGSGITNQNSTVGDSATDGAAADHTGPTYTFTSVTGGLEGATRVQVTDTGDGGNAVLGIYLVSSVTDDNTVELTTDPTNGTNETGIDWEVPATAEFYIGQHKDYDIRILGIQILIADTAIVHNKFGNGNALTIGWDLKVIESGEETFIIEKAKTGGQLVLQSSMARSYGADATSFEFSNWTSTEDAQTAWFPMGEFVPGGFRIGRGSHDRLVSVVNDDSTGLTLLHVRTFGCRLYP